MSDDSTLTLDKLTQALESIRQVVYYAVMESQPQGAMLQIKETDYAPEFFVFNPNDFELFKVQIPPSIKLVHIREYKPTQEQVLVSIKKLSDKILMDSIKEPRLNFYPRWWR